MMKIKRTAKREPADPYECWCMPCSECIYWNADEKQCDHPEAPPRNEQLNK